MFHQHKKSKILPVLIIILFFVFVYAPVNTMAQSLYKSTIPPGGSGSTIPTTQNDGNSISPIWVIIGVATGLVLFYKFVIQKEDDKKAVKDTTSTSSNVLGIINNYPSIVEKIKNENTQLPFKLYLGIRRDDPVFNNKTYVLGVSFNL